MPICPLRFTCVARTLLLFLIADLCCSAFPQSSLPPQAPNNERGPHVVLKTLWRPAYPSMAIIARLAGDVSLTVSVHPDGSVESVKPTGFIHPDGTIEPIKPVGGEQLLVYAAVDSAKHSRFECANCTSLTESEPFTFSFRISEHPKPADPCCCTELPNSNKSSPAGSNASLEDDLTTIAGNHITVMSPGLCVCPDACPAHAQTPSKFRFRSARCLYLWKCSTRLVIGAAE